MASCCGSKIFASRKGFLSGWNTSKRKHFSSHGAAYNGHKNIVEPLLELDVDAEIKNHFGNLGEEESYSSKRKKRIQDFREKDLNVSKKTLNSSKIWNWDFIGIDTYWKELCF